MCVFSSKYLSIYLSLCFGLRGHALPQDRPEKHGHKFWSPALGELVKGPASSPCPNMSADVFYSPLRYLIYLILSYHAVGGPVFVSPNHRVGRGASYLSLIYLIAVPCQAGLRSPPTTRTRPAYSLESRSHMDAERQPNRGAAAKARAKEQRKEVERRSEKKEQRRKEQQQQQAASPDDNGAPTAARAAGQQQTNAALTSSAVCNFFLAGKCNKGDKCRFLHAVERVPATAEAAVDGEGVAPALKGYDALDEHTWQEVLMRLDDGRSLLAAASTCRSSSRFVPSEPPRCSSPHARSSRRRAASKAAALAPGASALASAPPSALPLALPPPPSPSAPPPPPPLRATWGEVTSGLRATTLSSSGSKLSGGR